MVSVEVFETRIERSKARISGGKNYKVICHHDIVRQHIEEKIYLETLQQEVPPHTLNSSDIATSIFLSVTDGRSKQHFRSLEKSKFDLMRARIVTKGTKDESIFRRAIRVVLQTRK
ncbi:hypothetical protein CEXT_217781, partial [Caerostris extrusa]